MAKCIILWLDDDKTKYTYIYIWERERQRQRRRDRQTDIERQRQKEGDRKRETERERHRETQRERLKWNINSVTFSKCNFASILWTTITESKCKSLCKNDMCCPYWLRHWVSSTGLTAAIKFKPRPTYYIPNICYSCTPVDNFYLLNWRRNTPLFLIKSAAELLTLGKLSIFVWYREDNGVRLRDEDCFWRVVVAAFWACPENMSRMDESGL